jgi:putative oxidoreductase
LRFIDTFHALGVLRIVTALLFIEHGTQKLLGFPVSAHGTPALFSLFGLAAVLETFGGLLVLIGFRTRVVAFILSGEMAVAYWMAHAPRDFFPVNNGGDPAVLFCFLFLVFAVAGAGAWSIEGRSASPQGLGAPAE